MPVIILFAGALAVWLVRKRSARLSWGVATIAAVIAWVSTLLISRGQPVQTSVSVWRPIDLFAAQIELKLDAVNAQAIIAGATVVLAVVLSTVVQVTEKEFRLRALTLAYGGLALMAMLSANLLTVALSWAAIDLLALFYGLGAAKDSQAISSLLTRIVVDVAGIFAIIGAAIVNRAGGGMDELAGPMETHWATALLVVAVILRIGLIRLDHSLAGLPGVGDVFQVLFSVMPPAAAVVILARQFAFGIPNELVFWLRVTSAIGLSFAGVRWMLDEDTKDRQRFLTFGMVFLGILVSTAVPDRADAPLISAVVVALIVGALSRIARVHSPWQRALPVLAALFMVLPAWTAGALLVQGIATAFEFGPNLWIAILGIVGLAMLAVGVLRDAFEKIWKWYVDDLARILYSTALLLPVIMGFGLGGGTAIGLGLRSVLVSLLTAGTAVGGIFLVRRMDGALWRRMREATGGLNIGPVFDAGEKGLRWVSSAVRALGGILEGEGAMLWVLVILMMIQLAITGAAQ